MCKNLVIVLLFLISAFSYGHNRNKVIGINNHGIYKLTISLEELNKILQNQLNDAGIHTELTSFEIKKDFVEDTNEQYFYLLAKNKLENVKIAVDLNLNTNNEFVARLSLALMDGGFSGTCTCSGTCTQGCDPKHWRDSQGDVNWKCSNCTQSKKTCNKSVKDS